MPQLQGHFTTSNVRNPLARVLAAVVLVLLSIIVIAIAIIVILVAIPVVLVTWIVIGLRRLWGVRRLNEVDSRVNVRVRENQD